MGFYVGFDIHNKEISEICKKYNLPVDIEGDVVKAYCYVENSPEKYYGSYKNEFGNVASWLANVLVEEDIESHEYLNEKAPDADFSGASKAIEARAEELSRATKYSKYYYWSDDEDGYACYYSNEKQNGKIKIIDVICDEWKDEVLNEFTNLILYSSSEDVEKFAEEQGGIFFSEEKDLFYGGIKNNTSSKTEKKTPTKTTKAKAKKNDAKKGTTGAKAYPPTSPLEWFHVEDGWLTGLNTLLITDDVVIPDCVENIAESAFMYVPCDAVYIPDSVKIIEQFAFSECRSLQTIVIPDSVTCIGECAFSDTLYFKRKSNWENGVLYICNHLIDVENTIAGEYTIKSGTKTIADYAIYDCKKLTKVIIPESVTNIGEDVFGECENLTICAPIGSCAEKYAKDNKIPFEALSSEVIAEKEKKSTAKSKVKKEEEKLVRGMIRKIGECTTKPVIKNKNFVLTFLSSEQEGKITSYITKKGGFVRSSTVLDTDYIIIADGNWNGESAKSKRALELNTTRGKNIKALTETDFWRFMGKDEYGEDEYDEDIYDEDEYDEDEYDEDIYDEDEYDEDEYDEDVYDEDEYDEDYSLNADVEDEDDDDEYITVAEAIEKLSAIEEGVKALAAEAEAMAKEAEKREKEEKKKAQENKPKKKSTKSDFKIVDNKLMEYRGKSETVVIPDNVKEIGFHAFPKAEFVKEITIPESVEIIGVLAFSGTGITNIEIPAKVKKIRERVFYCCESLEKISVSENNKKYCSVDGALYTKDKQTLVCFPARLVQERQETPSFITEIDEDAFGGCNNLKELVITDNVVNLKKGAFSSIRSMKKVVFGKNLKSIGEGAFEFASYLEDVVLNDGLEIIGKNAFLFANIKELVVPGTVKSIGVSAFETNRELKKVVLNEGVKVISTRSFAECGKLEEVHLPASLEKISQTAFQSSNNIQKIYIPKDSPALETVRKIAGKAKITLVEKPPVNASPTSAETYKKVTPKPVTPSVSASPKPVTPTTNVTKAAEVKSATTPAVKTEPAKQKTVNAPPVKTETQNNKGKITGMDIFKFILVVYFVGLLAFVIFLLTNNILLPALIVIVCLVLRIKKLVDKKKGR